MGRISLGSTFLLSVGVETKNLQGRFVSNVSIVISEALRHLLEHVIRDEGFRVEIASDGETTGIPVIIVTVRQEPNLADLLVKPVNLQLLKAALRKVLKT